MPKRFLKPGITTSDKWNACSWRAQSFYVRLITLVDDYGRYDARPEILRAHAFPLHPEISALEITEMCRELAALGLATFYKSGEKQILQLLLWDEKARSASKFPVFSGSCEHLFADVSKCVPPSPSSSPSSPSSPTPPPSPRDAAEPEGGVNETSGSHPSLEQWLTNATFIGYDLREAETAWNSLEATAWQTKIGPVRDWRRLQVVYRNRHQERQETQRNKSKPHGNNSKTGSVVDRNFGMPPGSSSRAAAVAAKVKRDNEAREKSAQN